MQKNKSAYYILTLGSLLCAVLLQACGESQFRLKKPGKTDFVVTSDPSKPSNNPTAPSNTSRGAEVDTPTVQTINTNATPNPANPAATPTVAKKGAEFKIGDKTINVKIISLKLAKSENKVVATTELLVNEDSFTIVTDHFVGSKEKFVHDKYLKQEEPTNHHAKNNLHQKSNLVFYTQSQCENADCSIYTMGIIVIPNVDVPDVRAIAQLGIASDGVKASLVIDTECPGTKADETTCISTEDLRKKAVQSLK